MTWEQLEHLIRAAAVIADDDAIVVIGSQAILGQFPDAPAPSSGPSPAPPRKRRLQTLIFPEGVTFDGEVLGTLVTTFIFSLLGAETSQEVNLVDQLRTSWNSIMAWLREVQAWGETGSNMVSCLHDDYH